MDPLTLGVAALLSIFTIAGGFIFDRQEKRIRNLEKRLESLVVEHLSCREENARLKQRVRELEKRLGITDEEEAS